MKLVSFRTETGLKAGILTDHDTVTQIVLHDAQRGVLGLIERGQEPAPLMVDGRLVVHRLGDIEICAPIPLPARNIMCVGKNYREHANEFAASGYDSGSSVVVPEFPIIFTKAPTSVCGPGDTVTVPGAVTSEVDYEAEFAVIIGTGGRGITKDEAMDHVWGYTLINDLTARDLQRDHKQWFLGKSLDDFGPMGPFAVSKDEVDLDELVITGSVNGELRQKASAADLIFDVATLIETISAAVTLQAGDIIATGTPAGVGIGFDPARFLVDGDVVEVSATGLGTLVNTISVV